MRVQCIQSRRVADDVYEAGVEYEMDEARAVKYHDYFRPVATPPAPPEPDVTPPAEPVKRFGRKPRK